MRIFERIFRRNFFLVIYVRAKGLKFPIIIPVSLDMVEDIIESSVQLSRIFGRFVPGLNKYLSRPVIKGFSLNVDNLLELPVELFRELKKAGRITLVRVNDDDAHVSIKLY